MKNLKILSGIALLILAVAITYLGLQRESIFNPPIVTGVGFLIIGIVFLTSEKR